MSIEISPSLRLRYRMLDAADGDLLHALESDPEVMRYINGGVPGSRANVDAVSIPRMQSYSNATEGWGLWGAWTLAGEDFIGWVLVRPMEFFSDSPQWNNLELGWRFLRSCWGRGYASEAALHVANVLARQDKVDKLSAIAMPDNLASIRIMEKIGMQFEKQAIHKDPLGDELVVFYSRDV